MKKWGMKMMILKMRKIILNDKQFKICKKLKMRGFFIPHFFENVGLKNNFIDFLLCH